MKLVFDSTILIYFGKMNILDKLVKLRHEKIIPSSVFREVIEIGAQKGKDDSYVLDSLIKQGLFSVKSISDNFLNEFSQIKKLSKADAETLAIAKNKKGVAIIDDLFLRRVAESKRIECAGSVFILFELYKEKIIRKTDIKRYLDEMINLRWRCSTELYSHILQKINDLD